MTTKRTLIVDDEPDIRELLEITLGRMKIDTATAGDLAEALALLNASLEDDAGSFDLCLTDMQLPDGNGIELVQHINEHHPSLPVAMITAFGSVDTAISALKAGAFDYLQKPIDLDQLRTLVETGLRITDVGHSEDGPGSPLLGDSPPMDDLRKQVAKLARSQAPIYISGESGSGKEVAARQIHQLGPRSEGPFVPVNCGAIPSELMESEFFGHVKGSFTGAVADKQGLFQAANGGTLFLDEVADLPLSMQVKLLRAIQEKAIRPVGSHTEAATDVRILSATHKDLVQEVTEERFRQDLYYRLNVIELRIPSLRDHLSDVPGLTQAILKRLATEYGGNAPKVSQAAMRALQQYDFPGNIRELENVLERAYTLCDNEQIQPDDLQLDMPTELSAPLDNPMENPAQDSGEPITSDVALPPGKNLEDHLESIERALITQALEATRWNKTAAAKELGITFRALRYKLKKLDME
jgi:two-component system response regulator PilR (NtrC family)